jgi:RNA polymerase sigma-70 factor (ECF subfamily)
MAKSSMKKIRELIEDGDKAELARALIEPVLGVLLRRHPDEDEAVGLLPSTIKALLGARRRYKKGMSVRAWILSVVSAKVDAEKPSSEPISNLPEGETPEELATSDEIVEDVEALLSALPEEERDALELLAVEGISPKEAGTILKTPSAVVEQRAERGLAKIA